MGAVPAELGDIHPGAERGSGAGEADRCHGPVGLELREGVGQLEAQLDREGVALLGTVERDQRSRAETVDLELLSHRL